MGKTKFSENSILGIIYTFVLAAIIAVFVGITINTFHPAPEYPREEITVYKNEKEPTVEEQNAAAKRSEEIQQEFEKKQQSWAQLTSIIVIAAATLLVALGLFLAGKMPVLPNGILMGGLATIFYGVITAAMSESRYVIFGVVTASLAIIATAGYLKFVHFEK